MNFKLINDFISGAEKLEIKSFNFVNKMDKIKNEHIKRLNEETYGCSALYDFSNTELTRYIGGFQGDATKIDEAPEIYYEIGKRIGDTLNLNQDHMFFQYIIVGPGGKVAPHYDAGVPGYATYKCNICVEGPKDDPIHVYKNSYHLNAGDLYCFEANMFKHWLPAGETKRVHLSYAFIIPNADLGWSEDHPKIRLANRIWKNFINSKK